MQPISRSDTIGDFMDKCNANFLEIANHAGPKGETGNDGETGPRGRRGSTIKSVPAPELEEGASFTISDAQNLLLTSHISDEDDIVVFTNGYVGTVSRNTSETEDNNWGTITNLFSIVGPEGPQGPQGATGDSLFEEIGGGKVKLSGGRILRMENTLEMSGTNRISFGSASSIREDGKLIIDGGSSGVKINGSVRIGTGENIKVENGITTIGSGQNEIRINSSQTEFTQRTVFKKDIELPETDQRIVFGHAISGVTNMTANRVYSPSTETNNLAVLIPQNKSLYFDNTGLRISTNGDTSTSRNVFSINTSVSTSLPIVSSSTVKVNNGDGQVLLDTPKYTMMVYPSSIPAPKNWTALKKDIYIENVEEVSSAPQEDGNDLYFKFKVTTTSGGQQSTVQKTFKIPNYYNNIGLVNYSANLFIQGVNSGIDGLVFPAASIKDEISDIKDSATGRIYDLESPEVISEIMMDSSEIEVNASAIAREDLEISINYYAYFIKNMLNRKESNGSTSEPRDMSNVFTKIIKKTVLGETNNTIQFVFPKPTPPANGLVWIFKHN